MRSKPHPLRRCTPPLYSAAKAALNNYAKNLSRQVAAFGIRVNTICPGNIYFPGGSWEGHLASRKEAVEAMLKTEAARTASAPRKKSPPSLHGSALPRPPSPQAEPTSLTEGKNGRLSRIIRR